MGRKPRQPERSDSAEGSATPDLISENEGQSAMDKFKRVARRLVRVNRQEFAEQERSYEAARAPNQRQR
jgi:hypothetical protein